jgi:hypothetical protein
VNSPKIEPFRTHSGKNINMNADCALIFYLRAGDYEPVEVQGLIQLHKPHHEGVLER